MLFCYQIPGLCTNRFGLLWNNNSARENREVLLVLGGEAIGDYYLRVFDADWRNSGQRLFGGLVVALVLVAAVAVLRGKRIRFEEETDGRHTSKV